jgi:hypothetical protein
VPLDYKNRAIRSRGFYQLRVEESATYSMKAEYSVVRFLNGISRIVILIGTLTNDMACCSLWGGEDSHQDDNSLGLNERSRAPNTGWFCLG